MDTFPKILGLIPARQGSKGLPNKHMKLLDGKPLIYHTMEAALQSGLLHTIAVSTDDQKIIDFAEQFPGIEVPFKRPKELAEDSTPSIDVVRHAVDHYGSFGTAFDYVVLLQPTSPFRSLKFIDKAILYLIGSGADSLVSIQKIPDALNPYWAFRSDQGALSAILETNQGTLITRRQDLPDTYYRDGKVYIARTSLVREGLLIGGKIVGIMDDNKLSINIDTRHDWEQAKKAFKKWKNSLSQNY